jgi:hypothetical protein
MAPSAAAGAASAEVIHVGLAELDVPAHFVRRQLPGVDQVVDERLYLVDDGWIVKGAAALLARNLGMRATVDIDV